MMGRFLSSVAVLALGLCFNVLSPVNAQSTALAPVGIDRAGWKVTADSEQQGNLAGAAIDANGASFWHTQYTPSVAPLPHTYTIDMQSRYVVNGFTYLPRQDASNNGNIGGHNISVSLDGTTWTVVETGTWANDKTKKTVFFTPRPARYVRVGALTEAQGAGNQWSSAAEFTVLKTPHSTLSRQAWKVSADSQEQTTAQSYNATSAIDGSQTTYWHTQYGGGTVPPLPHYFIIDQGSSKAVAGITYLPRPPSTGSNGNIGSYRVESSADGATWTAVCTGTWPDNSNLKTAEFAQVTARYFRLVAVTEAGNRGQWASASEINLLDGSVQLQDFKVTVDSQETASVNNSAMLAMDGDLATIWHTQYTPSVAPLPHQFTIDMQATYPVKALHYTPRQDGGNNGNIGNHSIDISIDGQTWTRMAQGSFIDDATTKIVNFQETAARYVRLTAFSEAGNRGQWSSAAEISVDFDTTYSAPNPSVLGQWGNMVNFPLVPVAAALLPNGKLLTWSSNFASSFGGGNGATLTATYDPATGYVSQRLITNTAHDMFCPGLSIDFNGRPFVTGGNNAPRTSIYDSAADNWISGPDMQIARGYQASQTLSDGRIFTIGGSWSGNSALLKDGESYSMATGTWSKLPGCPVRPMLTADAQDAGGTIYRSDNHGWFFAWSNATVLQAGPSKAMHWYTTTNGGGIQNAGLRGADNDAMNGNAVMYDAVAGKIFTVGGGTSYQLVSASTAANVLTVGAPNTTVQVTSAGNMNFRRAFHNSKVLPDGSIFIVGGQEYPNPFYDDESILYPELWSPKTGTFKVLAPMVVPRTYHSVAILLPDATVFSGGGGLCGGCSQNHFDGQIFSPPYLFTSTGAKATRPVINTAPTSVKVGATLSVTTGGTVTSFALVRLGSATHTVDTDQRRIPFVVTDAGPSYSLTIPADPGVALPGYYMLFAINSAGVPSVAKMVQIQPVAPIT